SGKTHPFASCGGVFNPAATHRSPRSRSGLPPRGDYSSLAATEGNVMSAAVDHTPQPAAVPPARPPRVAYLLADAGITLADSRKGPSIHVRSMIRAFLQEGCEVD